MTLLLALACQSSAPATEVDAAPAEAVAAVASCADYASDRLAFEFCAFQQAGQAKGLDEAQSRCEAAGRWQGDCVEAWLAADGRRCGHELTELLALCPDEGCRFSVLDACPNEGVVEQIDACEAHAGRFARDCVGHALQRWLTARPTAEEAGELMSLRSHNASVIGSWAGLALVRLGEGSCEDPPGDHTVSPESRTWCQSSVDKCAEDEAWCKAHWTRGPARGPAGH